MYTYTYPHLLIERERTLSQQHPNINEHMECSDSNYKYHFILKGIRATEEITDSGVGQREYKTVIVALWLCRIKSLFVGNIH